MADSQGFIEQSFFSKRHHRLGLSSTRIGNKHNKQKLLEQGIMAIGILQNARIPFENVVHRGRNQLQQPFFHHTVHIHLYSLSPLLSPTLHSRLHQPRKAFDRIHLVHHQFIEAALHLVAQQPQINYTSLSPSFPTVVLHLHPLFARSLHVHARVRPLAPPIRVVATHLTHCPAVRRQRQTHQQVYKSPRFLACTVRGNALRKNQRAVSQ